MQILHAHRPAQSRSVIVATAASYVRGALAVVLAVGTAMGPWSPVVAIAFAGAVVGEIALGRAVGRGLSTSRADATMAGVWALGLIVAGGVTLATPAPGAGFGPMLAAAVIVMWSLTLALFTHVADSIRP